MTASTLPPGSTRRYTGPGPAAASRPSNGEEGRPVEILPGIHEVPGIAWSRMYLIEGDALTLVDSGMPLERPVPGALHQRDREEPRRARAHPDDTQPPGPYRRRPVDLQTDGEPGSWLTLSTPRPTPNRDVSLSYMGAFTSLRAPAAVSSEDTRDRRGRRRGSSPLSETVQVIHTPGHTPGSACYLLPKRGVLFTGDTLFSDGARLSRSVPFPGYDGEAYRESLRLLASLDFDVLCGGHGAPLVGAASDVLRQLLVDRPDPPSWRRFFASIPGQLFQRRPLTGEE